MDIKDIHTNISTQQHTKVEKLKDDKLETQSQDIIESTVSLADSVYISPEARALFNDGGGHPARPPKV